MLTPGLAPGYFFVTPKLSGCNIFVAYDRGLHQHWIIRVSAKYTQKQRQITQAPKVSDQFYRVHLVLNPCKSVIFSAFLIILFTFCWVAAWCSLK